MRYLSYLSVTFVQNDFVQHMMMMMMIGFVVFLYHSSFWIVFDCIETDFKDEMRGKHLKFFFLYNYQLVCCFFFFNVCCQVCVYLNMLRVPKTNPPSQMKCLLLSLGQLLQLFGALRSKMTVL